MKIGDRVVCVKPKGPWRGKVSRDIVDGPKYLEEVTIEFCKDVGDVLVLWISGYTGFWNARHFRPIDYNFGEEVASEIEELINEEELV